MRVFTRTTRIDVIGDLGFAVEWIRIHNASLNVSVKSVRYSTINPVLHGPVIS